MIASARSSSARAPAYSWRSRCSCAASAWRFARLDTTGTAISAVPREPEQLGDGGFDLRGRTEDRHRSASPAQRCRAMTRSVEMFRRARLAGYSGQVRLWAVGQETGGRSLSAIGARRWSGPPARWPSRPGRVCSGRVSVASRSGAFVDSTVTRWSGRARGRRAGYVRRPPGHRDRQASVDAVMPETVRSDPVARTGRSSLRHSDQVQVGQQVVEVRVHERPLAVPTFNQQLLYVPIRPVEARIPGYRDHDHRSREPESGER
jgi:hypothetical protein